MSSLVVSSLPMAALVTSAKGAHIMKVSSITKDRLEIRNVFIKIPLLGNFFPFQGGSGTAVEQRDGGWTHWAPFSSCNSTCGRGWMLVSRQCQEDFECKGKRIKAQECGNNKECPTGVCNYTCPD